MNVRRMLVLLSLLSAVALPAAAQEQGGDALDRAKVQYEAAAYEDALSILGAAEEDTDTDKVQLEQYRALCLIALGRLDEAASAIAALVAADPTYVPASTVASPRVLSIVTDIRKRELPTIVRGLMDEGRTAYQRKDFAHARQTFELVLSLAADPVMQERPENEDIRVVAQGFVDLARAAAAPPPAPASVPAATGATASSPAAAAAAAPDEPVRYVAAIPIEQTMPAWEPPGRAFASVEYNGTIRVRIGVDGRVKGVTIDRPSHPAYDARLLQVAPTWRYQPATRNGEPIESEKTIAIRLQPPAVH